MRSARTVRLEDDGLCVLACFGADACPRRVLDAPGLPEDVFRALAALEPRAEDRERPAHKAHTVLKAGISYCPNACARSQIADIGLIAACVPRVDPAPCAACGACAEACREDAVRLDGDGRLAGIDPAACLGCGECARACPTDALVHGAPGFRLLLGGKLGRHPRLGEELPGLRDPWDVPALAAESVRAFRRLALGRERMGDVVARLGAGSLLGEGAG